MKILRAILTITSTAIVTFSAIAQSTNPPLTAASDARPAHKPPPQAYTDCVGKKAGDTVQHTTREGKVAATCETSPMGLVARPKQPAGNTGATAPK